MPNDGAPSDHAPAGDAMPVGDIMGLHAQLAACAQTIKDLTDDLNAARVSETRLVYELQNRVRNMLAVIRSNYRRSRENGASQDEFAEHFEGRLNAVARYHTAIVRPDTGIDLEDMIRDELLDVHSLDGPGLTISGPAVCLSGKTAELMGLAIHELTTNAIKFGALYHEGALTIEWTVVDAPAGRTLTFNWKEDGVGALATAPRPTGFGRQFIEEALPYQIGATTSFDLKPGGIDCSIILPLPIHEDTPQFHDTDIADAPSAQDIWSESDDSLD